MQVSFMLKEVEVAPCHLARIVGRATGSATRTGEAAAGRKVDADVETARLRVFGRELTDWIAAHSSPAPVPLPPAA